MKVHGLQSRLAPLALCAVLLGAVYAQQSTAAWKDYLGGPDSSHYSPLKQITLANVDRLEIAWSYSVEDEGFYTFSPLVVDNIAYVSAKQAALVALDATTGKELWVHTFPGGRSSGIGGQRGANYWESKDRSDRRIFVTSGAFLNAIDARTGARIDSFADHGRLDLKAGVDRTLFRWRPGHREGSSKI